MESDGRYYWRRATEERAAASRALTPEARLRHIQLADVFTRRMRRSVGAQFPYPVPEADPANVERLIARVRSHGTGR